MSTVTTAAGTTTTIDDALAQLGATDDALTPGQYAELDTNGFLAIPGVIDAPWLSELRARTTDLQQREDGAGGSEVGSNSGGGAAWLADLINKGEMFERTLREPRVLAAVHHVLGDFRINSLNFRSAIPGFGNQNLHSDTGKAGAGGPYELCNSMWMLDDFTADNGGTKVVPGTHLSSRLPADEMDDPGQQHPHQIQVTGKAGTVVIFNAQLWHGGANNSTEVPRRGMTLSFCRPRAEQQTNQAEYIRKKVYDRLSPAERFLLDV
ncbi:MAG: phytanoyl-CoA dioxygenase family protein [Nakamurella sp.]